MQIARSNLPALLHIFLGTIAVVLGGMLSAFLAHEPSRVAMWASAYLVLVAGVAQVAFGLGLYRLIRDTSTKAVLWVTLAAYNLGNAGVLLGQIYHMHPLIIAGAVGIIGSLICLLVGLRGTRKSYLRITLSIIVVIIIVTAPIGILLSYMH